MGSWVSPECFFVLIGCEGKLHINLSLTASPTHTHTHTQQRERERESERERERDTFRLNTRASTKPWQKKPKTPKTPGIAQRCMTIRPWTFPTSLNIKRFSKLCHVNRLKPWRARLRTLFIMQSEYLLLGCIFGLQQSQLLVVCRVDQAVSSSASHDSGSFLECGCTSMSNPPARIEETKPKTDPNFTGRTLHKDRNSTVNVNVAKNACTLQVSAVTTREFTTKVASFDSKVPAHTHTRSGTHGRPLPCLKTPHFSDIYLSVLAVFLWDFDEFLYDP